MFLVGQQVVHDLRQVGWFHAADCAAKLVRIIGVAADWVSPVEEQGRAIMRCGKTPVLVGTPSPKYYAHSECCAAECESQ